MHTPQGSTPAYLVCCTLLTIASGPGFADDQAAQVYELTYGEAADVQMDAPNLLLEVNRFADIAPAAKPGTTFSYNNAGYNILAAIIEQLTGSYQDHLQTRIYNPLGMADSCNHESKADVSQATRVTEVDGFYKDIFMSGGANLTSRKTLHAAESLGLTYEYYAGKDRVRQNQLLIGTADDENGLLLYPDGQPRFRMLYVNGGAATKHGMSLTRAGRSTIRRFNRSGGSYCGSCAGSFLSGLNVDDHTAPRSGYLHLFPYNTLNTGLKKTRLGHYIPDDSPLYRYRSFGDDQSVEDI